MKQIELYRKTFRFIHDEYNVVDEGSNVGMCGGWVEKNLRPIFGETRPDKLIAKIYFKNPKKADAFKVQLDEDVESPFIDVNGEDVEMLTASTTYLRRIIGTKVAYVVFESGD